MLEKQRSGSVSKSSGSDIQEKGPHQDLVSTVASHSFTTLPYPFVECAG